MNGASDRMITEQVELLIEKERRKLQDVQDYLSASGESSARARTLIVALVVASVLTGVGVLNSLQSSWMHSRVERMRQPDSDYLIYYIGERPKLAEYQKGWDEQYQRARVAAPKLALDQQLYSQQANEQYKRDENLYNVRYQALLNGASRGLIDTRFFVHIPFFGTTVDVNDLGILAGVGLTSLLLLLWFSMGTELSNLKIAFAETKRLGILREFYRLAAMRQVLTIPSLPERYARWFEVWLAKPVYFVPVGVYFWLFAHDISTNSIGTLLGLRGRIRGVLLLEFTFCVVIVLLSILCFQRSRDTDGAWAKSWLQYMGEDFVQNGDARWLKELSAAVSKKKLSVSDIATMLTEANKGTTETPFYVATDNTQLAISLKENRACILRLAEPDSPQAKGKSIGQV